MSLLNHLSSHIHAQAHRAREHAHNIHQRVNSLTNKDAPGAQTESDDVPAYAVDLAFRFLGARGLPAMDIGALSDPFFVANLDGKIEYKSSVQPNTLNPVWNEQWFVKNVPHNAALEVKVYDKDNGQRDDFIGSFKTTVGDGKFECIIEASSKANKGTMFFELKTTPTRVPNTPQYSFDGPVNFSRHASAAIGRFAGAKESGLEDKTAFLAALPDAAADSLPQTSPVPPASARLYSTWKYHLKGVPLFFGDAHQHWLESYPAAQKIFTGPPMIRASIRSAHRILYARTTMNSFGLVQDANDLWRQLAPQDRQQAMAAERALTANPSIVATPSAQASWVVKPALYTYVIDNGDRFRFSETGAALATDFASKHALHACCAESVRYAGEYHARPLLDRGWAGLEGRLPPEDVEWELWIDNASGTYGPDPELLPKLRECIEYNFPGIKVKAFDFKDEELAQSKKDMKEYAQSKPHLMHTASELHDGDVSHGSVV
ncbi:C2-domain-containing protein [Exidia glandulosa HHB12029]|uniref:C2-domain-containing protein n=1 Tax=Exidia glandulosa HHB12029 TaxID=1314781 RepID=A0A165K6U7_EXIGL|nr:C2-domain-containing protein [Exidia glandulosa HHB12029]